MVYEKNQLKHHIIQSAVNRANDGYVQINSLVDGSNVNEIEGGLHMKIKPSEWFKLAPADRYVKIVQSSMYVKGVK